MTYPWQENLKRELLGNQAGLSHALLLHGQAGIGKRGFAEELARDLLCEHPADNGSACGRCVACGWLAAGTHPDFQLLQPDSETAGDTPSEEAVAEKGKKQIQITIAQVRELINAVNLSSSRGGRRVILIHPAEAMNVSAANALLKTLEEPQSNTLFILVSHQMQRLPATVRSRCLKIAMPMPTRQQSLDWLAGQGMEHPEISLAQAGNAPLRALDLTSGGYPEKRAAFLARLGEAQDMDPLALAETSEKLELAWVLNWLQTWVYDLAAAKTSGSIRFHLDFSDKIMHLAKHVDLVRLFDYQHDLLSAQKALHHPLNTRLLLEQLLLTYWQVMNRKQEPARV